MKVKGFQKIIIAFIVFAILASMISIVNAATSAGGSSLLEPNSITATSTSASGKVQKIMGSVLGIVQAIAVGVAIIMLIVLGIKYVSASPQEKAEYKKGIQIYIIGAVMLFGASFLLNFIKTFTENALSK